MQGSFAGICTDCHRSVADLYYLARTGGGKGLMDNSDIRNTAQLMIDEFGGDAEHQAFKRANQALLEGNPEGEQIWRQVVAMILEIKNA